MKKILNFLKKYRLAIITILIFLIIGIIILIIFYPKNDNITLKEIDNSHYSLSYDNTWEIEDKQEDLIILKHQSGSKITISLTTLIDDYRYLGVDELIDELLYNVHLQNPSYNLVNKQEEKITKYEHLGYKVLYENNAEQVLLEFFKNSDELIVISYEADNEYFDILLDSVETIIYNLKIKQEDFNLKNNLQLDLTNIDYNESEELDNTLISNNTYEIANNNYYVKYSIPSNFMLDTFDSTTGRFYLKMDSKRIDMTVSILNTNLYKYIEKTETGGLYDRYSYYKDNEYYINFTEKLAKLNEDDEMYIYQNSYYTSYSNELYENVELIYPLNNSHILIISLRSSKVPITKKLIEQIKIIEYKNYASYIKPEKIDNYLIGNLQRYSNFNNTKIDSVTLKLPDKYEELDKQTNFYLKRNYALNYNENLLLYDYEVHYELTILDANDIIENFNTYYLNTNYGAYHNLTYTGDLTLNGKTFKVYDGGYTTLSGIMYTDIKRQEYYKNKKFLFYEIPNNGNLYIEIDGNGHEITNDILNEITNFTFETKNV